MLYAILCGASVGFAQPTEPTADDSSLEESQPEQPVEASELKSDGSTDAVSPSETDISMLPVQLTLNNGIILTGSMEFQQLLIWTPQSTDKIRFYMDSGTLQEISSETISSIVQITHTPEVSVEPDLGSEEIPEQTEAKVVVEDIPFVPSTRGFSFQNPAASRYLYAPSSIPLQQGQGYVSQKLFFTSGVLGVSDNFTLLVGTTIPFPVISIVGGKYAKRINENWHVGAGAEVFFLPFAGAFDNDTPTAPLSIGFVSATYGDLDSHLTFATGVAYEQVFSTGRVSHPVMIAGHKRLSDRLAVVTENWLMLNLDIMADGRSPYTASINSLAFRFIGNRSEKDQWFGRTVASRGYPRATWDFGLVFLNAVDSGTLYDPVLDTTHYSLYAESFMFGPIPWVDYTWHFGPARK